MSWMRLIILGMALLGTSLLCAQEFEELREEWRSEVHRLEREIGVHKSRYAKAMERSERFEEEASWTHFEDHARYRNLMGRSAREKEYADESKQAAEKLMDQRDKILQGQGLPGGPNDTPW